MYWNGGNYTHGPATIRLTNRTGWCPPATASGGGGDVDADILCLFGDQWVAAFDLPEDDRPIEAPAGPQPAEDRRRLGLVIGYVSLLPKKVQEVVGSRAIPAIAWNLDIMTTGFKLVQRADFQEARYRATVQFPERRVFVGVKHVFKGRTVSKDMLDTLCERVWVSKAVGAPKIEAKQPKSPKRPFLLDDTSRTQDMLTADTSTCFDDEHVYALDSQGQVTDDVGAANSGSVVAWVRKVFASPATKWLSKQAASVRKFRYVRELITALHAPAAPTAMYGTRAQHFFSRARYAGASIRIFRGWPSLSSMGTFELCNGQHGVVDQSHKPTRCCCGLINTAGSGHFSSSNVFSHKRCGTSK